MKTHEVMVSRIRRWLASTTCCATRCTPAVVVDPDQPLGGRSLAALPLTAGGAGRRLRPRRLRLHCDGIAPFILFSLPGGVWLDRVRKLPVYIAGETMLALAVASVPLAWWLGWLAMPWLYTVAFFIGTVYTIAGSAAQVVLTQVVSRDRLVEAHAKNSP
jgi:hypothetical protein